MPEKNEPLKKPEQKSLFGSICSGAAKLCDWAASTQPNNKQKDMALQKNEEKLTIYPTHIETLKKHKIHITIEEE